MNERDDEIDSIHQALKAKHLTEGLAELWEDLKPDEVITGRELALILQSARSKVAKGIVLLNLILDRLDRAADDRAADEVESVYADLHRKPTGTVHGSAREEAEDLS